MSVRGVLIGAVWGMVAIGCGGNGGGASSRDAGGGTGGSAVGGGGTSGASGGSAGASTGGAGPAGQDAGSADGDGSVAACNGACIETFFSECSRSGQTCVSGTSGPSTVWCYSNGVKWLYEQTLNRYIVRKPDGQECLQIQDYGAEVDYFVNFEFAASVQGVPADYTQMRIYCVAEGVATYTSYGPECDHWNPRTPQQCPADSACTW